MIGDCGLRIEIKSAITNPKSEIELAEGTGLEPVCDSSRQFSGLLPHRFGLPSESFVRTAGVSGLVKLWSEERGEEITFFFARQKKIWQARSDLNWKLRFWRPTFCQLKLRTLVIYDLQFAICDLQCLQSQIANCKSQIFGVSDGIWTRNIRFGRPLLSHLSFAHKIWNLESEIWNQFGASGKIWTFIAKTPQFYRLLALTDGDRCEK